MSIRRLEMRIAKLEKEDQTEQQAEAEEEGGGNDEAKRQTCNKCHHWRDQYRPTKPNGVS